MYEIIIAILIIILFLIIMGINKRIDTLRDSYTEFLTQYTVYVKAVGDHSEAVQGALEDLDNKAEKGYSFLSENHYATTALAAHVEYLDKQLTELKEFVEYQDKRLIGAEQND